MKKTDFPFNNAGGLKQILAIPESSFLGVGFTQDCKRFLNLTKLDDIICIGLLPSDGGYQENRQEDDGDVFDPGSLFDFLLHVCSALLFSSVRGGLIL